jgi:hypothetical protein
VSTLTPYRVKTYATPKLFSSRAPDAVAELLEIEALLRRDYLSH